MIHSILNLQYHYLNDSSNSHIFIFLFSLIFIVLISSGTGVPLSVFCHSYYSCMFFIVIINPWICFFGAFNKARIEQKKTNSLGMDVFISDLVKFYKTHLLHPDDWFSLWRLNCRLVSYHSHLTQAKGYKQEVRIISIISKYETIMY